MAIQVDNSNTGVLTFKPASSGNYTLVFPSTAGSASQFLQTDGSGNLSWAAAGGTTTNAVTFNNGGAGAASGTTFNGSSAVTVSYNTIGAPSTTGTNASGTWSISVTGDAGTLNSISAVNLYNNMNQVHSTRTSFDATTPSYNFGYRYVQGSTNGPGISGATQYYSWYIGLGSDYPATGAGSYGAMFAVNRAPLGGNPYLSVRFNEGNSFNSWQKIYAGFADTAGALTTGNNYQVNSLGVNTAASGTAGEIRATNNITAYYSDERLKTRLGAIENALDKLCSLDGFYYQANEIAQSLGYEPKREVGVSAQQVQAVMPEVVAPAPIDDKYLTVRYEKLVPLLIEAIKELSAKVDELQR